MLRIGLHSRFRWLKANTTQLLHFREYEKVARSELGAYDGSRSCRSRSWARKSWVGFALWAGALRQAVLNTPVRSDCPQWLSAVLQMVRLQTAIHILVDYCSAQAETILCNFSLETGRRQSSEEAEHWSRNAETGSSSPGLVFRGHLSSVDSIPHCGSDFKRDKWVALRFGQPWNDC